MGLSCNCIEHEVICPYLRNWPDKDGSIALVHDANGLTQILQLGQHCAVMDQPPFLLPSPVRALGLQERDAPKPASLPDVPPARILRSQMSATIQEGDFGRSDDDCFSTLQSSPHMSTHNTTMTLAVNDSSPNQCDWVDPETGRPCKKNFACPKSVDRHKNTVHNALRIRCDLCPKKKKNSFGRWDTLRSHYRVFHHGVNIPSKTNVAMKSLDPIPPIPRRKCTPEDGAGINWKERWDSLQVGSKESFPERRWPGSR